MHKKTEKDLTGARPASIDWSDFSLKNHIDQPRLLRSGTESLDELRRASRPDWAVALALLGAALLAAYSLVDPEFYAMPAAFCIGGAGLVWLVFRQRTKWSVVREFGALFEDARQQVEKIYSLTNGYLDDLDKRTSRYFHCVTNTKVTAYFKLRQIETGLVQMLHALHSIHRRRPRSLLKGFAILQGPFVYYDGLEFNSGQATEVTISDLTFTVTQLIRELEAGINALEAEIRISREISGLPE